MCYLTEYNLNQYVEGIEYIRPDIDYTIHVKDVSYSAWHWKQIAHDCLHSSEFFVFPLLYTNYTFYLNHLAIQTNVMMISNLARLKDDISPGTR